MILIKSIKLIKHIFLMFLLILPITSCDTLESFQDLKNNHLMIQWSLIHQILCYLQILKKCLSILPPILSKMTKLMKCRFLIKQQDISNNQFVQPQVQNFVSPPAVLQSSKSPSDSIEKFRNMKKFTIGEWVYGQSVREFKGNNLYYEPQSIKVIIFQEDTRLTAILINHINLENNIMKIQTATKTILI